MANKQDKARYSDEELQEFKELILAKIEQAQRQLDFIRKLQAALIRIENKTYGVCRITGKLIPKERLLAVPHATLSIEGKEIEAKNKKQ